MCRWNFLSPRIPLPLAEKVSGHILNILPVLQKFSQLILEEHSGRETWVDSLTAHYYKSLQTGLSQPPTSPSYILSSIVLPVILITNMVMSHPYFKNLLIQRTLSYRVNSKSLSTVKKTLLNWYQPSLVFPLPLFT